MDPVILTTAFVMGYLMYRLGLPPLVGFLLAGLSLSVFGFESTPALKTASDVGVTLLLFTIGLKLKVKNLLKPEVWGAGTLHMGLTVAVFGFALFCLGYSGLRAFLDIDLKTALLLAFALSFSSTVFAVKILDESNRMNSLNGRTAIGVLIIQDIVAVVYLTLSTGKLPSPWALLVFALLPVARMVLMPMLSRVGHGEMMVLMGMFMALIAGAHTFEAVRLKPDLGALIIGMLVAQHPRAKEMANALMSVKDILLVGFFLDIGLTGLPDASGLIATGILVGLLPLKLAMYFLIFTRFTLKARTAFVTTMNLANYSEFGLIVSALAAAQGYLDKQWLVIIAIALSITMVIASPLNKYADRMFDRIRSGLIKLETRRRHPEEIPMEIGPWEIIIVGMGRIGKGAYDYFHERFGNVVMGFDFDRETVDQQRKEGRHISCVDAMDIDSWRRLPTPSDQIRMVVLALNSLEAMRFAIDMLKQRGSTALIAAVARHDDEVEQLKAAGADAAFNVFAEAGAGFAADACEALDACRIDSR